MNRQMCLASVLAIVAVFSATGEVLLGSQKTSPDQIRRSGTAATQCDLTRFNQITTWTGTLSLTGSGGGQNLTDVWTVDEHISGSFVLSLNPGAPYDWAGTDTVSGSVNNEDDRVVPPTYTETFVGSGDAGTHQASLFFDQVACTYTLDFDLGSIKATDTFTPPGTQTQVSFVFYPAGYLVPSTNVPIPASGLTWSGNASFRGLGGLWDSDWTVMWRLVGHDYHIVDDPCHANADGTAQSACENQAVSVDPPIVGTPFELHYQSERQPGRAGASNVGTSFSRDLGGWTLNVRHAYDPGTGDLYLGDGTRRSAAMLGTPVSIGGNYLVTDEGAREVYVFDSTGRHLRTVHPLTGASLYQFGYDAAGHLATVTDVAGKVTTIQRDGTGNPTAIVGPYGQQTKLTVNADGYATQITNPNQESSTQAYGSGGLIASRTDALGAVDHFVYNSDGLLTHADHAGVGSEDLVATAAGPRSVSVTTAAGLSTTFALDFSTPGTVAETITYPSGLQGSFQTSSFQQSLTRPDGMKASSIFAPDPRWGVQAPVPTFTQITTPAGLTIAATGSRTVNLSNTADPLSLISQVDTLSINARTYTRTFTANNRTLVDLTPAGRTVTTVLDASGHVTQRQVSGLLAATYAYDSLGRLSSIAGGSGSDARTTSVTYGSDGNVSVWTDPLGHTRTFTHDAAGRVTQAKTDDGRIISSTFDANGNVLSLTPPGRSAYTFAYTPTNRLSMVTVPSGGSGSHVQYAYDPDGRPTRITQADGQTLTYAYDGAGRLGTVTTPTATLGYHYDVNTGRLTGVTGASGADLSYSYDGDLLTGVTWAGTVAGSVRFGYDNNFRITSVSVGATAVPVQYDADGLVVQAGGLSLTRDAQTGLRTATSLGSVTDATSYNGFGEPVSYSALVNGSGVYSAQMTRDTGGRLTTVAETLGGSTTTYGYAYDAAGRLVQVTRNGTSAAAYSYDSNGNRLSYTAPAGATTSARSGAAASSGSDTTYGYDLLGNLAGVTLPDATQIAYLVDGRNRRVGKRINGLLVQEFLYLDALRPVAELDGAGHIVSVFVYGRDTGAPDYLTKGGNTYRIISDAVGSPRLVINAASGLIVQQLDYDAFGNVLGDTNPGFQPFGFAGGLYDRDTGLVRFGARDYDPSTGRWTAKDPTLFDGGDTNLYAYVSNDPVNATDPEGTTGANLTVTIDLTRMKVTEVPELTFDLTRMQVTEVPERTLDLTRMQVTEVPDKGAMRMDPIEIKGKIRRKVCK
jgi:RHS repeat-associated protein